MKNGLYSIDSFHARDQFRVLHNASVSQKQNFLASTHCN